MELYRNPARLGAPPEFVGSNQSVSTYEYASKYAWYFVKSLRVVHCNYDPLIISFGVFTRNHRS